MTWNRSGFSNKTLSKSFMVDKTPTTIDYITWQLPTAKPIVPGSLKVIVNAGVQTHVLDYVEGLDLKSFQWVSPESLGPTDDVRTDFLIA